MSGETKRADWTTGGETIAYQKVSLTAEGRAQAGSSLGRVRVREAPAKKKATKRRGTKRRRKRQGQ